ncbi:MAG: Asr1405/Asl0597 family protein [Cyanobacteria bacterium J06632_22]
MDMLKIDCADRWQAYFRLCELGITCRCCAHQPLEVDVASPQAAVQIYSVLRQSNHTRLELADWLERCWMLTAK